MRSRPWSTRSTALTAAGVVCFLLYLPTKSAWCIVLAALLMGAGTIAAVLGIRNHER
jgi:hypothetical protein